jgi:uncharacterized SAM-binding protein YcdF (DUF218 family)
VSSLPPTSRARRAAQGIPIALAAALLANDLRLADALSYRGERALLVPAVVVVAAILCGLGLRRVVLGLLAAVAALWLAVAFTPLDRALVDGLPRIDPLRPADAIYVLASDVQPDGDLTTESMARLVHGLELVGAGLAPRLLLGELAPPHGRYADAARRLLDAYHLQTEVIGLGPVTTTREEGLRVAELFRERGWHRVLLVTSSVHSRRAAGVFEAEGLEVVSAPTREAKYDLEELASSDERLRAFPAILHERLGIWIYRRRGWVNP